MKDYITTGRNDILSRVQNRQSYLGSEIRELVEDFKCESSDENELGIIKEFEDSYIDGESSFPIKDDAYYFLINKSGRLAPMRDKAKSPKKEYLPLQRSK